MGRGGGREKRDGTRCHMVGLLIAISVVIIGKVVLSATCHAIERFNPIIIPIKVPTIGARDVVTHSARLCGGGSGRSCDSP